LLFDAHARDSAPLCMGPVPSAHGALRRRPARDDVGRAAPLSPTSSRRCERPTGRSQEQAGTQSTSPLALRCACARQCAAVHGVPCLRPTARCAVGLHGM